MNLEQLAEESAPELPDITPAQRTVALWIAQNVAPTIIERMLTIPLSSIAALRCRPDFNLLVDSIRKELVLHDQTPVEDQVQNMTKEVVAIIKHHCYSGNEKISLNAAQTLFDRQMPKRTLNENINSNTIKIESEALDGIFKVFREMAGLKEKDLEGMSEVDQLKLITERSLE